MAGLKKPDRCECGSVEMHREYRPERWVCDKCTKIIVSRGTKPQTGVCRECGKLESEVPFDNHGNICRECKAIYNKQYGIKHKEEIRESHKEYYAENRDEIREKSNAYWQGGWTPYLSELWRRTKRTAVVRVGGKPRKLDFTITREDVYALAIKQDYKCAITKQPMVHEYHQLTSASIDRIDSDKGYTIDNIQLVHQWANLGKKDYPNSDFLAILEQYFQARILAEGYKKDATI